LVWRKLEGGRVSFWGVFWGGLGRADIKRKKGRRRKKAAGGTNINGTGMEGRETTTYIAGKRSKKVRIDGCGAGRLPGKIDR